MGPGRCYLKHHWSREEIPFNIHLFDEPRKANPNLTAIKS